MLDFFVKKILSSFLSECRLILDIKLFDIVDFISYRGLFGFLYSLQPLIHVFNMMYLDYLQVFIMSHKFTFDFLNITK
jgi:hypothetical protein